MNKRSLFSLVLALLVAVSAKLYWLEGGGYSAILIMAITSMFGLIIICWECILRGFIVLLIPYIFIITGLTMNLLVVISNNGKMPALGNNGLAGPLISITPNTEFPFLCDRFTPFRASLGDIVAATGIMLSLIILPIILSRQKVNKVDNESQKP